MLTLQDLEQLLPSITTGRMEGRSIDWAAMESRLGLAFPADFKELSESYPSFSIGGFLMIATPSPGREDEFIADMSEPLQVLADLSDDDEEFFGSRADPEGMTQGNRPYPEPDGVLPIGQSVEGDQIWWRVSAGVVSGVVIAAPNGRWSDFNGGIIDFLCRLLTEGGEPAGFPSWFPGENPLVEFHRSY